MAATEDKNTKDTNKGEFTQNTGNSTIRPGSSKQQRTLQTVKTHFYVGTEDGELVYLDWMPAKDQDTGKLQSSFLNNFVVNAYRFILLIKNSSKTRLLLHPSRWTYRVFATVSILP